MKKIKDITDNSNYIINNTLSINSKNSLVADSLKINEKNTKLYKSLFGDIKIDRSLKAKFKKIDSEIEREIKNRKKLINMLKKGEYLHEYLAEEEKLKDFVNTTKILKNVLVYDNYEIQKNTTIFNSQE